MKHALIEYDYTNMLSSHVGRMGAHTLEKKRMLKRLRIARKTLIERTQKKEIGFLSLGADAKKTISVCRSVLRQIPKECDTLLVIGIGGSDLGAKAIIQGVGRGGPVPRSPSLPACPVGRRERRGMRVEFAGSTTEPDEVRRVMSTLNPAKTCINVVSKSGGTIEPLTVFLVFREWLIKSVGIEASKKRIVVTTDPKKSPMLTLAKKCGYLTLPIPSNVGGRYSALTACGIFPSMAAGCNVTALLQGANHVAKTLRGEHADHHPAVQYALLHLVALERKRISISVCMPYVRRLSEFGRWTRQLIAESLGKEDDIREKKVHAGITPISARGPEDQHSQLQLYAEGPFDKAITFIEERISKEEIHVPVVKDLPEPLRSYSGLRLGQILRTERKATAEALRTLGRPNGTIYIQRMNEEAIGALLMMFEISTVLMGFAININPFDQPGVELSKHLARKGMGLH
ncbi:MAG: hypothetical protein WC477_01215 [Patescibacteria group bacterium]